jgi:hypothetical protein
VDETDSGEEKGDREGELHLGVRRTLNLIDGLLLERTALYRILGLAPICNLFLARGSSWVSVTEAIL